MPHSGHSCVFIEYVPGEPTRIVVSDQMGITRHLNYPYLGFKYVLAANLSRARLVTSI